VPLGLSDEFGGACTACRVSLMPGDVLLVASDGLGSVEGPHGEHFDDGRLRQVLAGLLGRAGDDVISGLAADAITFGHGRRLQDDVNLVAIWRPAVGCGVPGGDAAVRPSAS
jgi:serine phosphatase RsbU (regulator of sigma subunit)